MLFFSFLTLLPFAVSLVVDSRQSRWQGKQLRILPLGASITHGDHSSTGDGYRSDLRSLLSPAKVTYIGSQCSGKMKNGNNEGHPGFYIDNMQSVSTPDLLYKPNVILLFVGTNDMIYGSLDGAVTAYKNLVKFLVDKLPTSLIVVGKLIIESAHPGAQAKIDRLNSNLTVQNLGGYSNLVIADFSHTLTTSDLADGEHPNDSGYQKMANVWYSTLSRYVNKIGNPSLVGIPSNFTDCNGPPP